MSSTPTLKRTTPNPLLTFSPPSFSNKAGSSLRKFYNDNSDLVGSLNVSFAEDQNMAPSNARSKVAAATESDVDRRTTAVMAHAQLKGVVEGVCPPSDVASDLEMVDPLRLEKLGVSPNDAVRLYRAVYKYTRVSVESLSAARDALLEMGSGGDDSDTRGELLGHLWHLYASAWEGAAGESFPSRVVEARALAPSLHDARSAVEVLTNDLDATRAQLALVEEEAAQAQVEADALRPFVTEAEEAKSRAESFEKQWVDASARGDALAAELASTSSELQRVHDELEREKAASAQSVKNLKAMMVDAAIAAAAELAAAKEKAANDLIGPTKALADTIIERDAALAGERDAKKVTAVLKADVAFLREKRRGAMDDLEVALLRAREAEDRQNVAVRAAKEAKAAAAVSDERCTVAEKDATGLRVTVSGLETELSSAKRELDALREKVDSLEGEDVRRQLKLAKGRADLAESELGEAKTTRDEAVEKAKSLEVDMEAADKERRSALRAAKKSETLALELEKKVKTLGDEKVALKTELETAKQQVVDLEIRVGELGEMIAAAEKEVKRLTEALEKETKLKEVAEQKTRELRTRTLETLDALEAKSAPAFASLEKLTHSVESGLASFDKKFAEIELEIRTFCEEKVVILTTTELDLQKWTGDIAVVSQAAMDKANGAVNMLVSTIKTLKETEAQLSAAEEELDIVKMDLGKTSAELSATTTELVKTKTQLEESKERTYALETSTAEMKVRLQGALTTLETTTTERNTERSGRLQANLAKSIFRMLKNKFQADAENAGDALVDAEEALEAAKTSRAIAHVNAAQAKIRLALLRNARKNNGNEGSGDTDPEPPPYLMDAQIMEGTPSDLVPYQKMLTDEYHAASVQLKKGLEENDA